MILFTALNGAEKSVIDSISLILSRCGDLGFPGEVCGFK
jgi:hypothetical protein